MLLAENKAKPLTKEETELINSVTFKVFIFLIIVKKPSGVHTEKI